MALKARRAPSSPAAAAAAAAAALGLFLAGGFLAVYEVSIDRYAAGFWSCNCNCHPRSQGGAEDRGLLLYALSCSSRYALVPT